MSGPSTEGLSAYLPLPGWGYLTLEVNEMWYGMEWAMGVADDGGVLGRCDLPHRLGGPGVG